MHCTSKEQDSRCNEFPTGYINLYAQNEMPGTDNSEVYPRSSEAALFDISVFDISVQLSVLYDYVVVLAAVQLQSKTSTESQFGRQ